MLTSLLLITYYDVLFYVVQKFQLQFIILLAAFVQFVVKCFLSVDFS